MMKFETQGAKFLNGQACRALASLSMALRVFPRLEFRVPRKAGFTIIEAVVYVAVLSVLVAIVVASILSLSRVVSSIRGTRNLTAAEEAALDRMARAIRDAKAINLAQSALDASPGVLALTEGPNPESTRRFFLFQDALIEEINGSVATLTPAGLHITNLIFRSANENRGVKMEISFAISNRGATTTHDLFLTAGLRGAYQ